MGIDLKIKLHSTISELIVQKRILCKYAKDFQIYWNKGNTLLVWPDL